MFLDAPKRDGERERGGGREEMEGERRERGGRESGDRGIQRNTKKKREKQRKIHIENSTYIECVVHPVRCQPFPWRHLLIDVIIKPVHAPHRLLLTSSVTGVFLLDKLKTWRARKNTYI